MTATPISLRQLSRDMGLPSDDASLQFVLADVLRAAFDRACNRFDLANDWECPARCHVSEAEHSRAVTPRRQEVDRLWRLADQHGVDVADIARRWEIGRGPR